MMKINEYTQNMSIYMPSAKTVAKCAATVGVAAVALNALASIPAADAGPITYSACVTACTALLVPAIPACLASCLASLGPWCP